MNSGSLVKDKLATIRVMTFNVRGAFDVEDRVNMWKKRASLNVQIIKRSRADIIGFQEFQSGHLETYQEYLPEYEYVLGPRIDEIYPYTYDAIAWNSSRFTLIDSGGFWLSTTPEYMSSDWGSACVRVAVWVKLRCVQTGRYIFHMNTHLDHISELARLEGSKLILRKLSELGASSLPVVLTGDFNCSYWLPDYGVHVETAATGAAHCLFLEHGFVDTYLAADQKDSEVSNTFHAFEGPHYVATRFHMAWRVDWILLRSGIYHLKTRSCTIIHDAEPPLYPSDHYPVLAELTWER